MNSKNLIEVISEKLEMDKKLVTEVLTEMNTVIIQALSRGDSVKISGFGTFYPLKKKARKGRNPKTGDILDIPSKTVPKFRAGKTMKEQTEKGI